MEIATLGAGCFWCIEAILLNVTGITSIDVGYTGGQTLNPTYKTVCEGNTGHAEVAQIEFDSTIISYEDLLNVFFEIHDPTTINRQGNDVGTQYRSAIFYHSNEQLKIAEKVISYQQDNFENKIVTQLAEHDKFYKAEDYHQNYYNNNKKCSILQFCNKT